MFRRKRSRLKRSSPKISTSKPPTSKPPTWRFFARRLPTRCLPDDAFDRDLRSASETDRLRRCGVEGIPATWREWKISRFSLDLFEIGARGFSTEPKSLTINQDPASKVLIDFYGIASMVVCSLCARTGRSSIMLHTKSELVTRLPDI